MESAVLRVQFLARDGSCCCVDASAGEPLAADDEHRRPRVHLVGGGAAEPRDQRACVLAAERAQLSGEDDEVTGERLEGLFTLHVRHAPSV